MDLVRFCTAARVAPLWLIITKLKGREEEHDYQGSNRPNQLLPSYHVYPFNVPVSTPGDLSPLDCILLVVVLLVTHYTSGT